jgi:phosphoribosylformylglycinamidine synthase
MNVGIIVFPGSNCDHDAEYSFKNILGLKTKLIWHKETSLKNIDLVFLPGGFSFGDYLRCGSIARFSPIMNEVIKHAHSGKAVMGVCNGFQILTECDLLPGALLRNQNLQFICDTTHLKITNSQSVFTQHLNKDELLKIPIAHGEGNYTVDSETLKMMNDDGQIVFRYSSSLGQITDSSNPNGSVQNIAGIVNKSGNVIGMMPHPERAVEHTIGSADGLKIFASIIKAIT